MNTPCVSLFTTHLTMLSILLAVGALLVVGYLIHFTRRARLGARALQVLGGIDGDNLDTAYEELQRIEGENEWLDRMMRRGFKGALAQRRAVYNNEEFLRD